MAAGERLELGEVELRADWYVIVEVESERYDVVRRSDQHRVGGFRGSPTFMWLLEPEEIELDLLRSIVRSAIVDGLLDDIPSD